MAGGFLLMGFVAVAMSRLSLSETLFRARGIQQVIVLFGTIISQIIRRKELL